MSSGVTAARGRRAQEPVSVSGAAETLELSRDFVSVDLSVNAATGLAGARRSVRDTAALCAGEAGGGQIADSRERLSGGTAPRD